MATLSTQTRSTTITLGEAGSGPWDVGYRVFDFSSVTIYVDGVASTNFAITLNLNNGFDDDAQITANSELPAGTVIVVETNLLPERQDNLLSGPNLVEKLNIELGRVWSTLSDLTREKNKSLRAPSAVAQMVFTEAERARRAIVFDANGTGFTVGPTADEISNAQGYAEAAENALLTATGGVGFTIGTDIQAYNDRLSDIAGVNVTTDDKVFYIDQATGRVFGLRFATPARNLISSATAAEMRAVLELAGLATVDILDEDDMASDSATRPPSQQSVKAYVDAAVQPRAPGDIGSLTIARSTVGDAAIGTLVAGSDLESVPAIWGATESNASGFTSGNLETGLVGTWQALSPFDDFLNRTTGPYLRGAGLWQRIL